MSVNPLVEETYGFFKNRTKIILFGILLLALLLRIPNFTESIWYDELWSTRIRLTNLLYLGNTALYDQHPPIHSILMFGWIRVFGDSELSIRLVPLIFGMLSIVVAYLLTLKIIGRKTALLTAFLLCVSVVHIWYSQEARPYLGLLFAVVTAIYSYYRLQDDYAQKYWLFIYILSITYAVFSHFYAVIYLAIISFFSILRSIRMKRQILLANNVVLGMLAAYLIVKYLVGQPILYTFYLRPFRLSDFWQLFFKWFLFGNTLNNQLLIITAQFFFLFVFIRGIFILYKKTKRNLVFFEFIFYLFALPTILLIISYLTNQRIYIERSLLLLLPYFLIVLSLGCTSFKYRCMWVFWTLIVVVFNVFVLFSYFNSPEEWTVYKPNPDWRSAASYFQQRIETSKSPIPVFASTNATVLIYYGDNFFEDRSFQDTVTNKIAQFEQRLGKENLLTRFISVQVTEFLDQIYDRRAKAQLFIRYPSADQIDEQITTMLSEGVSEFYLIENQYFSGDFEELAEYVRNDPRAEFSEIQTYKGITILVFNVKNPKTFIEESWDRFAANVQHIQGNRTP